jgi:TRAP-type C4-dicarboxylate transport system substrate-binding protein
VLVSLERLEAEWAETTKYLQRILDLILLDKELSDKERRHLEVALSPTFDLHLRYQFDERKPLGYGLVAVVYRALHKGLKQVRALKVLKPEHKNNKEIVERFLREGAVLGGLKHPNIVQVYDSGGGGPNLDFYLEMEYVDGVTLYHFIRTQDFNWERTLKLVEQLGSAMKFMHTHGIIHRDLNPRNIMVDRNGDLKVMDFGVAKIVGVEGLTRDGQVVGTTAYMSPEQARGEKIDERSDIFSFGVILYELCTRHLPSLPRLPLRQYEARVPRWIERIIDRCLKQERELRYSTMEELLDDIESERSSAVEAKCVFHPTKDAVGECVVCGRTICNDCLSIRGDKSYCTECARKQAESVRRGVLEGRPPAPAGRMTVITSLLKRAPVRALAGLIVIAFLAVALLQVIPSITGEKPATHDTPSATEKGAPATPSMPASVAPVKLVYETFLPESFQLTQSNISFFDKVAKLSDGAIDLVYRYEIPYTSDPSLVSDVSSGAIDCGLIPLEMTSDDFPLSQGLLFKCLTCKPDALAEAAMNVYNSYAPLREEWEIKNNVKVLYFLPMTNSTLCTAKAIGSVTELSSLTCGSTPGFQDIIEMVGAEPCIVSVDYCYTALDRDEIDGAFFPLYGIYEMELFKVADTLIDTATGPHTLYATAINKDVWEGLPDSVKSDIESLSKSAVDDYMKCCTEDSLEAIEAMKAAGMDYYLCPAIERKAIEDLVIPAQTQEYTEKVGDSGQELLTLLKEEIASCEKLSTFRSEYDIWQTGMSESEEVMAYEDDFSDPTSGWARVLNESGERAYKDGEYHLTIKKRDWWVWDDNLTAGKYTDFELEVDGRVVEGPGESGYGLIFRFQNNSNFYLFGVFGNGKYNLRGYRDRTWLHLTGGQSGYIEPAGKTNRLKVVCIGSKIETYVNGHLVATVEDDTFTDGSVGVTAYSSEPDTHVTLDNFRVRSLP